MQKDDIRDRHGEPSNEEGRKSGIFTSDKGDLPCEGDCVEMEYDELVDGDEGLEEEDEQSVYDYNEEVEQLDEEAEQYVEQAHEFAQQVQRMDEAALKLSIHAQWLSGVAVSSGETALRRCQDAVKFGEETLQLSEAARKSSSQAQEQLRLTLNFRSHIINSFRTKEVLRNAPRRMRKIIRRLADSVQILDTAGVKAIEASVKAGEAALVFGKAALRFGKASLRFAEEAIQMTDNAVKLEQASENLIRSDSQNHEQP
jgi:hypothetical protein